MSSLDPDHNRKETSNTPVPNPLMVPDYVPDKFEEAGISHGALEKLFYHFAAAHLAHEIDPEDEAMLEKEASTLIMMDKIFTPYNEESPEDRAVTSYHVDSFKLPDGRILAMFDNIDKQFYSILPILTVSESSGLRMKYESLQNPVKLIMRYDEELSHDGTKVDCAFQTFILGSREAYDELASKISVIGNYLKSSLKDAGTDRSDIPVTSYFFENFLDHTEQRLATRAKLLPAGNEFRISDIVEAKRVNLNYFTLTLMVDHVDNSSGKPRILASNPETHIHFAGIDASGIILTRWVNELLAEDLDKRKAA